MPARGMRWLAPNLLPLSLSLQGTFTEMPLDMALFHVCIPFTAHRINPRCAPRESHTPKPYPTTDLIS